jgi:hypothetical protein
MFNFFFASYFPQQPPLLQERIEIFTGNPENTKPEQCAGRCFHQFHFVFNITLLLFL